MGKLRLFSQLTVNNVFNHQIPSALYRDGYSTNSALSVYNRGYWSSTSTTNSRRYGTPSTYTAMAGARSITFDFGLKF